MTFDLKSVILKSPSVLEGKFKVYVNEVAVSIDCFLKFYRDLNDEKTLLCINSVTKQVISVTGLIFFTLFHLLINSYYYSCIYLISVMLVIIANVSSLLYYSELIKNIIY